MASLLSNIGPLIEQLNRTLSSFYVNVLVVIFLDARKEEPTPPTGLFKPMLCHKEFWKFVLAALKKHSLDLSVGWELVSGIGPPPPDASDLFFMKIFQLIGIVLQVGREHWPNETAEFVRLLVRAKMFDTLDEVLPKIKGMPQVACKYTMVYRVSPIRRAS